MSKQGMAERLQEILEEVEEEAESGGGEDSKIEIRFPDGEVIKGRALVGALISEGNEDEQYLEETDCPYKDDNKCDCDTIADCPYDAMGANVMIVGNFKDPEEVAACGKGIEEGIEKYYTEKVMSGIDEEMEMMTKKFAEFMKENGTGDLERDIKNFLDDLI